MKKLFHHSLKTQGRGGLVVKSRLSGRRVPGSKPDSSDDPPCMGSAALKIIRSGQTPSRRCGLKARRGGYQPRCRHLTAVRNYEVRPKIAIVVLQSGALI
ncbi:hypothetical protein AVEN_243057-1 [Araneus ventricosus]|uniref:Uncharacterized protein n=1 Tax=Araneus ventricosus TaxID=182803 RepID=A0A4Y2T859_ARAVE|nr:hypothetical protein AVEN_243057-1 [Araneus ventricosus]